MSHFLKRGSNNLRNFLYAVYVLPLGWAVISVQSSANPLDKLQDELGLIALYFLLYTLYLSPLKLIFPKVRLLSRLIKYRRSSGNTAFFYMLGHFACYLLLNFEIEVLLENFTKNFVLIGFTALFITFILAATSNNYAVRKLGGKRWKKLHRLIYFLIPLLFLHITQNDKGSETRALIFFLPVIILEFYRFFVFFKKRGVKH